MGAAEATRSRLIRKAGWSIDQLNIVEHASYRAPTKKVRSLMTGEEVEIAADTPRCCDPSSETYWSM